ncbi:uncharacterized protein LOC124368833 isoform X2 [Homalodisca vitripennis]|uniref:uncharacterized protein LOC124368833 isoform X2 n=1 Tax=Homalodisca vitripennis TaxID=197043 RepID=UPI001EEA376F|nr:uncharacterized protein LOC124368833 isoform X2 [Homalodisca vitripennis]
MMPPGRIASLKPGTLIDLIQEEKPHRPVSRAKNRQIISQSSNEIPIQSSSSDVIKTTSSSKDCNDKSRDTNEILSKLSEQDLKKLIHENIGDLPIPTNLSFLVKKESDAQVSQNLKSSWGTNEITKQQFHVQAQNVPINNITLSSTANSTVTLKQNSQPNSWSPTHVNDLWKNISSKDPRRETMNVSALGCMQNSEVGISSDHISHSFVNSNDSFTKNTENVFSSDCHTRTSYNPPTLQTDPFRSPCYDGSSTPDPYRPDPYTLGLKENTEKEVGLLNLKPTQRSQLMEGPLRTPMLETPQRASLLESSQRHHIETPLHYSQDGIQRPSSSSQHIMSNDNVYTPMYAVNQQFKPGDPRCRSMTNTYAAWRPEESFDRKPNHFQESSSSYYNRASEDRRNYSNNYTWSREYPHSSQYNHRGRNYERYYKGSHNYNCPRPGYKQSDMPRKLSARDPRRKSVEESFDKIDTKKSVVDHEIFRQDPRLHEKNPLKDKRGKESHCDDKFPNKGRPVHSQLYEKSQYKKDDSARNSTDDPNLKDTYTSPLDKLYTNMEIPKTGLGYGIQKFRIPKIKKYGNDQSSKQGSKEKSQTPIQIIPAVTEENVTTIVTDNKVTHDKDNASLEVKSGNENCQEKDKQCENIKADVEEGSDIKPLAKSNLNIEESSKTKIQVKQLKTEIHTDVIKDKDSPTRRSKRIQQNQIQKSLDLISEEDSLNMDVSQSQSNSSCNKKQLNEEKSDISNIICAEDDKNRKPNSELSSLDCQSSNDPSVQIIPIESKLKTEPPDCLIYKKCAETGTKETLEAESPPDKDGGGVIIENQTTKMTSIDQDINETHESILSPDENKESAANQADPKTSDMPQHSTITSSFEVDCAIDLSLKKNTTDENLSNKKSGGIKNINNPPTVGGHPSQSFDSSIELNKKATRIAQVSPLRQANVPIVDSEIKLKMIQDVFGGKLTHDKILKVAELLKVIDSEETENDNATNILDAKSEENGDIKLTSVNKSLTVIEDSKRENDGEQITTSESDRNKSKISTIEQNESKNEGENKKKIPQKSKSYKKKRKTKPKPQILEKSQSKPPAQKTKRKYRNELDRLQDDISKYHDSEAIAAASGMRMCRLQKEKTALTQNCTQPLQDSKKKAVGRKTDTCQKYEKDDEPDDVDSTDSEESWNLLSEKLKLKYGHLMSEDDGVKEPSKDKKQESICLSSQVKVISDLTQENCGKIGKTSSLSHEKNERMVPQSKSEDLSSQSVELREGNQDKSVTDKISASQLITPDNEETKTVVPVKIVLQRTVVPKSDDSGLPIESSHVKSDSSLSFAKERGKLSSKEKFRSVKFSGRRSNHSDNNSVPNKTLSDNIVQKYKIRRQKKRCLWYAGIIKKKTKRKKSAELELMQSLDKEDINKQELKINYLRDDLEEDHNLEISNSEDLMIVEPPDKNYYQEGESKSTKCKLCPFSGKAIVSHYAITHPKDEVLISRMSPVAAETAKFESSIFFSQPEDERPQVDKFKCRVCYQEFTKFFMFFEHMALHTGEFRHECCKCGYRTSTRSGITKHCLTHAQSGKNAMKTSCRVLYKEPSDRSNFFGHLCSICNFFQIHHVNVKRHVENIHNSQDFTNIIKINFSKLPYAESVKALNVQPLNEKRTRKDTCEEIVPVESSNLSEKPESNTVEDMSNKVMEQQTSRIPEIYTNNEEMNTNDTSLEQTNQSKNCNENHCEGEVPSIELNTLKSVSVPDKIRDKEMESDQTSTSAEPETEKQTEKGCFELSPELDNYSQIIDEEVSNSYKKKCKEIVLSISLKQLSINKHGFIEKMALKQNSEENNAEKIYTLHCLVSSKIKKDDGENDKKMLPENLEKMDDSSETTPSRRQLPDRICKGLIKTKSNEIDEEEDSFIDFFQTDDHSNDGFAEEFTEGHLSSDGVDSTSTSTLLLFERQIERCRELNANKNSYLPRVSNYNSSLPLNSNLSEFTHVMKQISQFALKPTDCKEVTVGGLKVNQTSNSIQFSCSVKIFNKHCQFQTGSLETFGQHVNMLHHTTFWDGTCGACFVVFIQDSSSHDKAPIHTQSRAFCHLVREHLTFVKKLSRTDPKGSLSSKGVSEEAQARPKLRVRRLSGDKLSSSGPENVLTQPQMEVTGPSTNNESDSTPRISAVSDSDSRSSPAIDDNKMLPIPTPRKIGFGSPRTEGRGPTFMSTLVAQKSFTAYHNMCSYKKLRHLFKCMGANCSFTTMSSKEFTNHFDQHRDIYLLSPDEDAHKGFWRNCSYCPTYYSTSKELLVHIRKEHAQCLLQCGYCFYRAKTIANVHFHHTNDHQKEIFCALQCEQRELNLPPLNEKSFTDVVSVLRCTKDGCSLFTYMFHSFCNHLLSVHGNDLSCHFCHVKFNTISSLLKHCSEAHGVGLFQCLYCVFGTSTEHEIRLHLCYKHPSCVPKTIHRSDSNAKSTVGTNRESLKRIVFNKDEEKLLKHVIPLPPEETEEGCSVEAQNPSISETPPPKLENVISSPTGSPYRPVIFRGINSNPGSATLTQPQKIIIMSTGSSISPTPVKLIRLAPTSPNNALTVSPSIKNLITISPVMQVPTSPKKPGGSALSPCRIIVPMSSPAVTISPSTSGVQRKSVITSLVGSPVTTSLVTMPTTSLAIRRPIMTSSVAENTLDTTSASPNASFSVAETASTLPESLPQKSEEILTKDVEEKYFKCGNIGCNFESSTSVHLKNHLIICNHARQSQRLVCAFCKRLFKQGASLIEHLKIHGPDRFSCALCDFKEPLQSRITAHMKAVHNITNTILVPVDSLKQDSDKDHFVVTPKERQSRGSGKSGARPKKNDGMKTKFCLEEVDDIPNTAIFQAPLGCSLCPYETKVRSNLVRHISQHTSGHNVSQEEVVNPVPEKTEKMFDKMMNLAGSSHKKKLSQEEEVSGQADIDCQYKYVPEQLRYLCHLKECGHQTISESMLRFHITVIHKDDTVYLCPHCPESSNPIPIDQLGLHLKLHDSPLYKCSYCDHFSHIKRSIQKHQSDTHPDEAASVLVVRTAKPNQVEGPVAKPVLPADQSDEQVAGEEWLCCTMCSYKTKKKKAMLSHGATEHQMAKPFKCSVCNYESATDHIFKSHLKAYHPEEDACEVNMLYKKVTEVKKPNLAPIPPLWKRDNKRIKLIRGIKLDEKGDAPPPVATCINMDVSDLDILELKFGSFGRPSYDGLFECPRCPTFQVKNRQEMREHLYKDLEYKPFSCVTCKFATTQRTKVLKHINKVHNIDSERCAGYVETNTNQDMEDWVEKVIRTQIEIASTRELTTEEFLPKTITVVRKRRRSSLDVGSEVQTVTSQPSTSSATACGLSVPVDAEKPSTSGVSANWSPVEGGDTPSSACTATSYLTSDEKDISKNSPEKKKRRESPSKHSDMT